MGSVAIDRLETEAESVEAMGERLNAELRAELHRTEVQLNHWVAQMEQRLGDIQTGFEESMEARATEVLELRKAEREACEQRVHYAAVAKEQEDQLQEEMKRLEELRITEKEELPAKLEVLEAEHNRVAHDLKSKKEEMANRRYMKEEELSALGRGVLLYSRLGLDFESCEGGQGQGGASKCLRLVFRQISRADPERPFVIAVRIEEGGRYAVPECIPALPKQDLERMLHGVNETNDFGSFVSEVRRAFVRLAEAGL